MRSRQLSDPSPDPSLSLHERVNNQVLFRFSLVRLSEAQSNAVPDVRVAVSPSHEWQG